MARLPRFVIPDQPQRVIVRENKRSGTFCTDSDFEIENLSNSESIEYEAVGFGDIRYL
jgi:hypothetical protein